MEKELETALAYLDKVAIKLNIGIMQLWPWFVKQQYIDAFTSLGFFIVTIIITIVCLKLTIKLWRKGNKYDNNYSYYSKNGKRIEKTEEQYCNYSICNQDHQPIWVCIDIVCILTLLSTGVAFSNQFFDIFNAEYWAFRDVMTIVKP